MKTFVNSLMFLVFMISSATWSQAPVSGTVTDQANGLPLPGVNILIPQIRKLILSVWHG